MKIALEMHQDVAVFQYPPGYDAIVEELDDLLDRRGGGRPSTPWYVKALEDLVERHPWFIDGHAHLGNALYDRGTFKPALASCMRGYSLGTEIIPPDFQEFIEWKFLENRPFLRAAHGAALCLLKLKNAGDAIAIMERMLAWNPDDNQGIRYIIGSEYLRIGQEERARSLFETEAAEYPPYWYELALLQFRQGQHAAAATSLRRGFSENVYIPEILCGNPDPLPVGIWHGSSFAEPELAKEYAEQCGKLWRHTPDAIAFLRWLHTHPKVMAERAAVLEPKEALLWERDFDRRGSLLDAVQIAKGGIDDELSNAITADRTDRQDRRVSPWLSSEDQLIP